MKKTQILSTVDPDRAVDTDAVGDAEPPSKSQKKREMTALQDVGEELLALGIDQLKRLDLPEDLLDAVLEGKRIPGSKHTAMKRQRQYIGRLMRAVDPAPIVEQLAALKAPTARQNAVMHRAEHWRERLLDEPGALSAFGHEFPDAPLAEVQTLIAKAIDERLKKRPPRAFRELYQVIHALADSKAAAA